MLFLKCDLFLKDSRSFQLLKVFGAYFYFPRVLCVYSFYKIAIRCSNPTLCCAAFQQLEKANFKSHKKFIGILYMGKID